jgi:protein-tyrosine phosphatase
MGMNRKKPAVLFVCLGNICRSPLAEAAFRVEAARLGLDVEVTSAGIGNWHEGEPPDRRAQAVARQHGVDISGYSARQVRGQDFRRFSHIVALDHEILTALRRMKPSDGTAEISLLLDHVEGREGEEVADPYYGSQMHFEAAWAEVAAGAKAMALKLAGKA